MEIEKSLPKMWVVNSVVVEYDDARGRGMSASFDFYIQSNAFPFLGINHKVGYKNHLLGIT